MPKDNNSSAVSILLKEINELKDKVKELEARLELIENETNPRETISLHEIGRPPYDLVGDVIAPTSTRLGGYADLGGAPITAETEEGAAITLTNGGPRTAREAEAAMFRVNADIRNQYITAGAPVGDNIVLDYSAIRNAPNAVTHIQSASDALIVDFVDGQRQFIPLHISRQGMM